MATTNRSLTTMASNTLQPSVTVNAALEVVDAAVYGRSAIEFSGDADRTLTQAECDCAVMEFTDSPTTLTTARAVTFPARFPVMAVKNSTAQTLTLKKSGQTGITIAAGDKFLIAAGGTDVEKVSLGSTSSSSTQGRHAIYIAAGSMTPSASGGCASLATIASAAGQPDIQTLDFDATTQEYAQFSIRMPKSWDEGAVTFAPIWSHASTTTNFGVVFDLQGVAVSNDDTILANFGTAQTSTDTGGTTSDVYVGPESSAITIAGTPAAEDVVFFRISRAVLNGSDNMAVDARLHGITLYITTNADTDA